VKSPSGIAKVVSINRTDSKHVVQALSDGTIHELDASDVSLSFTSGFNTGDEVITVQGAGYVAEKRANDLVVKLHDWRLAQGQSPTLYLNYESAVKIPGLKVGSSAKTVWGIVKILEIRRDGTHVAEALHWKLADGKPPLLHLAPEAFSLLSLKP